MKVFTASMFALAITAAGAITGCTQTAKSADVSANIRKSLDNAGLKKVSVAQDRDKGIVTLTGSVSAEADKAQAAAIAQSYAGTQVVANEVAVIPIGTDSETKKVNSALDEAIASNLEAALIQSKLRSSVSYESNNRVVRLTGSVDSQAKRAQAEKIAAAIPNVQQVVNELQVSGQKATSTK